MIGGPLAAYKDQEHAEADVDKMRGWDNVEIVRIYWPDDPQADGEGCITVIQVEGRKYMRVDGYVR